MLVLFVINAVSHRPTPKDRDSGTALQNIASPASDGLKQAMHPVKALDAEISRRGCRRKQMRVGHIQPGFSGRQGICVFCQPGVLRFVRGAKFDDPGGSLGFPRPRRHNAVIIGNVHQDFGSGPCG